MSPIGGLDLGATSLRAAVAREPSDPLATERVETPAGPDGRAVARAAVETLEAAADRAGIPAATLESVGIGSFGPLDRSAGTVVRPPNLPDVDRVPLRDALVPVVGHPRIYLENDAVAGLVSELDSTSAPAENLVYLTLSTGIGAGVAVDGHVLRGRAGNAAEVGHFVLEPDGGRRCGCGGPGHWEAYSGGIAIPDLARDIAAESGLETELPIESSSFSAADVFATAARDPLAERVIDSIARYNAIGVANLVHAYAPERIAVGGAVALENPSHMVDPLADAVDEHTMLAVPEIALATHGHEAVLRGALTLAAQGGLES